MRLSKPSNLSTTSGGKILDIEIRHGISKTVKKIEKDIDDILASERKTISDMWNLVILLKAQSVRGFSNPQQFKIMIFTLFD